MVYRLAIFGASVLTAAVIFKVNENKRYVLYQESKKGK
jgi:hypothetical protein